MAVNGKVNKMEEPSSNMLAGFFRGIKKIPSNLVGFFKGIKAEAKRITWPSKEELKKATIAVLVFCAISIILIAAMDFGFNNLYTRVFK